MWTQLIQSLISLPCLLAEEGNLQPQVLSFSPEALNELYRWQEENARLCDTEPSDTLQSIYCKLEIYIIRFALIIQLMRWVCGESGREMIDTTSVTGAVALVEYFRRLAIFVQLPRTRSALPAFSPSKCGKCR
ncbi:DUF3987 domain-containing protein [Porphyromonas gulae]|uniref:DUF3987 domain-containing protein n=1 Tax=Porphyromonas gulae TaxID=111105 RepID=UPI00061E94BA|nr:DUF3987 domain-containing protein [Porphyromonas gulae]KKC51253.1 hypothetical protein HR10_04645 [Porphyromonas gulae]